MEKTLQKRLSEIQRELKVPKGQYNKFSNFYYRSCEDICEAVKEHLAGLTLTIHDEIYQLGERYYVKAVVTLTDGKETITNSAFARESENKKGMDDSQVTGATSSYARKYALNGLFLLDDTKDADSKDNTQKSDLKPQGETKLYGLGKKDKVPLNESSHEIPHPFDSSRDIPLFPEESIGNKQNEIFNLLDKHGISGHATKLKYFKELCGLEPSESRMQDVIDNWAESFPKVLAKLGVKK